MLIMSALLVLSQRHISARTANPDGCAYLKLEQRILILAEGFLILAERISVASMTQMGSNSSGPGGYWAYALC